MIEVLAWVITCIPIATAALLGYSVGAGRILSFGGRVAAGWAAGILTALLCLLAGCFQPFGLLTPILLGLLVAVAVRRFARRPLEALSRRAALLLAGLLPRASVRRCAGAVLGASAGAAAAAFLWLGASLANGALPAPGSRAPDRPGARNNGRTASGFEALLRTAHHGFVRHVPVLGPLGDEVEALTFILSADPRLRARLVHTAGWEKLADLPSLKAIVEDQATLDEIDGIREGHLTALYSLQKNPLILAFFREPEVQKLILEIRPSELAKQLEAISALNVSTSSR